MNLNRCKEIFWGEVYILEATLHGQGWLNYIRFPYLDHVLPRLNKSLIRAIRFLNPSKDRGLAHELHQVADLYDPRPTGEWK